jgi:hypothetical protein
VDDELFII